MQLIRQRIIQSAFRERTGDHLCFLSVRMNSPKTVLIAKLREFVEMNILQHLREADQGRRKAPEFTSSPLFSFQEDGQPPNSANASLHQIKGAGQGQGSRIASQKRFLGTRRIGE